LMRMMVDAKNGGASTQPPRRRPSRDFHCDTDHLEEEFHFHD
jgi:hypothetical protein